MQSILRVFRVPWGSIAGFFQGFLQEFRVQRLLGESRDLVSAVREGWKEVWALGFKGLGT